MKSVKLTQATNVTDRSDIFFKLSYPKNSNGTLLFMDFMEIKKDYFKGNPAFEVHTEARPDIHGKTIEYTCLKLRWIREVAQECAHYIQSNLNDDILNINVNNPIIVSHSK